MALEDDIRKAISSGRVNAITLWPTGDHRWQGNVRWKDSLGWTVAIDADAPKALALAMASTERFTNPPSPRPVIHDRSAKQVVEGPTDAEDPFGGLI